MSSISKENVAVGDRVYDLTQGVGTVLDTTFNDISVRFDNGVRITFDHTGNYGGVRRLYWHNPIVVEPPKDNKLWTTLVACVTPIFTHLKGN